jgi:hypothetical protein
MLIKPAVGKLRLDEGEFGASLGYLVSSIPAWAGFKKKK